jgi:hypothetical protein
MAKKAKSDVDDGGRPKSKMGAVRLAIGALGLDAATQALHDHIKSEYRMDINKNYISSYKSTLRRQAGVSSGRGRGRGGRPPKADTSRIGMDDIRAVKQLADRIGADRLRELMDVLEL